MHFTYSKRYLKHFRKLEAKQRQRVTLAIGRLLNNFDVPPLELRHHRLSGKLRHQWSISAGGDLRIHYTVLRNGDIIITFVDVGTHSQLY